MLAWTSCTMPGFHGCVVSGLSFFRPQHPYVSWSFTSYVVSSSNSLSYSGGSYFIFSLSSAHDGLCGLSSEMAEKVLLFGFFLRSLRLARISP